METTLEFARIGLEACLSPGYQFSKLILTSITTPSYSQAFSSLTGYLGVNRIILAYKKIHPDTYLSELGPLNIAGTLAEAFTAENSEQAFNAITAALQKLFPVYEDMMFEMFMEDSNSLMILPEHQLPPLSSDDLDEMLRNPDDVTPEFSLTLFFRIYDGQMGKEAWDVFKDRFEWPVEYSDLPDYTHTLDHELAEKKFTESELAPFWDFWLAVTANTGNPFVDYDEYDPYGGEWDFSTDSIVAIHERWAEAQPILDNCAKAEKMVREDPALFTKLAEIICQCFVPREK